MRGSGGDGGGGGALVGWGAVVVTGCWGKSLRACACWLVLEELGLAAAGSSYPLPFLCSNVHSAHRAHSGSQVQGQALSGSRAGETSVQNT